MIFVTGGTGFLGRYLIATLCRAGYAQRVLTRYPDQNLWLRHYPNVEVVEGDLRDGRGLEAMAGCQYVVHAAGLFSMWAGAGDFEQVNATGTEYLMQKAVAYGVQRVIYISTVAVIGRPQPNTILDEHHPPRPADRYQASKLHAEQIIERFHESKHIETTILRAGAFYGPLGDYAFNRLFFTDPMRGLIVQPDGGHYVIFPVYIQDVADAIVLALTRGKSGETYNICGACVSHGAVFDIVVEEAKLRWPRFNPPGFLVINFARLLGAVAALTRREPFYPLGLQSYVFYDWHVTSDKARRELGFVPTELREGVRQTLAWYRAGRPDWTPQLACESD